MNNAPAAAQRGGRFSAGNPAVRYSSRRPALCCSFRSAAGRPGRLWCTPPPILRRPGDSRCAAAQRATAAVSIGTTPACTTRARGDLLRHFAVGAGSVNHGKHFITVGDSGDSREGHADAGDGPGDNQRFTTGRFHRGDEFRVIQALISPLRAMYFACGAFS